MAETDTQTTGGDSSETATGAASQVGTQPAASTAAKADGGKTFSQDEVNRIVKSKAEREAKKMAADMLEEQLPVRLRALLEEKGLDPDNLDELPKQRDAQARSHQAQLTREKNAREAAEKERDEVKAKWKRDRIDRFILESTKTTDPKAFLKFARDRIDVDDEGAFIARDEDGNPLDGEDPKKALQQLLVDHPTFALPVGEPGAGSRPGNGSAARSTTDTSKLPFDHPERRAARLEALRQGFGGK